MEVKSGHAIPVKRVYVASDDSKVLAECRKSYPSFTFLGDQSIAKSAAVNSRYNLASLKGVISDIHMLSQSDYLVCTFSSQVWPLTQLFSVSFFVKKSLICLEGKSMTLLQGNTILFRSSQQLPRLRLGPSKGFLS